MWFKLNIIRNMKKTYVSPEINVVRLEPTLMLTASTEGGNGPTVAGEDEDIPGGVSGNSKYWSVDFVE